MPSKWGACCEIIAAPHMRSRKIRRADRPADDPSAYALHARNLGPGALDVGERTRDRGSRRLPQCASHRHRTDRMPCRRFPGVTDRGLMRLNRLGNVDGEKWQDIDFNVLTDDGEQRATKFFVNGVESTRRITTASGFVIQGTPTHRIKVVDPETGDLCWKRFGEITADDVVALSMGTLAGRPRSAALPPLGEEYWTADYTTRVPRTVTPELAELVGYFMGDGSLHAKGLRFCVAQADQDVLERLSHLIRTLFGIQPIATQKEGYVELAAHSVALRSGGRRAASEAAAERRPSRQGLRAAHTGLDSCNERPRDLWRIRSRSV